MKTRDAFLTGIEWMQRSARLMGAVTPDGILCDWKELDSKFEAFRLFQCADRELHAPNVPLDRLAATGDTFRSIWVLEGAGHIAGLSVDLAIRGLLTDGSAATLPESAMIPLHAGMGTAFAERLLGSLPSNPSAAEISRTLQRFIEMCGANCRPGWEDACAEPLGLVVRCLHPHLLAPVNATIETVRPGMRALLWHGVGRGLYFVPTNFLPIPGARERMVRNAIEEAGDLEARQNVLAGLIWAVTLVNLPNPAVIRSYPEICGELKARGEFLNGLISALMAWRHMAPEDTRFTAIYSSPLAGSGKDQTRWKHWIEQPAREAFNDVFSGLRQQNRIPALYTYRTDDELRRLGMQAYEDQI